MDYQQYRTNRLIEERSNSWLKSFQEQIKAHYAEPVQNEGWAAKAKELWLKYEGSHLVDVPKARYAYIKGEGKTLQAEGKPPVVFEKGGIYRITAAPISDLYRPVSIWLDHPDQSRWTTNFHPLDVVLIDFDYK